jgi:hypothetical protein
LRLSQEISPITNDYSVLDTYGSEGMFRFNPVTKKMESRTITTPGFSQEKAAATVEKAIRQATPEDVARKERVDFTGWLFQTLGGSNG